MKSDILTGLSSTLSVTFKMELPSVEGTAGVVSLAGTTVVEFELDVEGTTTDWIGTSVTVEGAFVLSRCVTELDDSRMLVVDENIGSSEIAELALVVGFVVVSELEVPETLGSSTQPSGVVIGIHAKINYAS